jgi:hypothetical protein
VVPERIVGLRAEIVVTATFDGAPAPNGYFLGSTRFNFHFDAMPPNQMCLNLHAEGPDFMELGDVVVIRIFILTNSEWRHLLTPGATFTLNSAFTVHFHGRIDQVISVQETPA